MKLNDYIQGQILKSGKCTYWGTVKALGFGLLAMLFCPGKFQKDGETIENIPENGAFRVFFGGIFMVLGGFVLIISGFLASAALLLALACLPITAVYIWAFVRVRAWLHLRRLLSKVDAASKAANRGE